MFFIVVVFFCKLTSATLDMSGAVVNTFGCFDSSSSAALAEVTTEEMVALFRASKGLSIIRSLLRLPITMEPVQGKKICRNRTLSTFS